MFRFYKIKDCKAIHFLIAYSKGIKFILENYSAVVHQKQLVK